MEVRGIMGVVEFVVRTLAGWMLVVRIKCICYHGTENSLHLQICESLVGFLISVFVKEKENC